MNRAIRARNKYFYLWAGADWEGWPYAWGFGFNRRPFVKRGERAFRYNFAMRWRRLKNIHTSWIHIKPNTYYGEINDK